jgi:hypothetical protein
MKLSNTFAVLAVLAILSADAAAQVPQSQYTQSQLNRFTNSSSASAYSVNRIRNSVYNSVVPQFGFSNVNRGLFSAQTSQFNQQSKPFSSYRPGPSVSPYLGLSAPFTSSATNYYTQVRPALEQQKLNDQMARQNASMQRQLNRMAVQPPYDPTGSEGRAPTGHASVFMNYGGYYQVPAPRR